MKTLLNLMEKRRNPSKNPTTSAFKKLEEYQKNPDIYISFTKIDKIGINPHNKFNTPTGIYTYPLKGVFGAIIMSGMIVKKWSTYGADRPFIQVLKRNGKGGKFIKDIGVTYKQKDLDADIEKLRKLYPTHEENVEGIKKMEKIKKEFSDTVSKFDSTIENFFKEIEGSVDDLNDIDAKYRVDDVKADFDNDLEDLYIKMRSPKWNITSLGTFMQRDISHLQYLLEELRPDIVNKFHLIKDSDQKIKTTKIIFDALDVYIDKLYVLSRKMDELSHKYDDVFEEEGLDDRGIEWSIRNGKVNANHMSAGGEIWNITRLVANGHAENNKKGSTAKWNAVWRQLGYVGVCDLSGKGIIHPAEKKQAIFFKLMGVDHVDMILNKSHAESFTVKNMKHFIEVMSLTGKDRYSWSSFVYMLDLGDRPKVTNRRDFLYMLADHLIKNWSKVHILNMSYDKQTVAQFVMKYGNPSKIKKNKKLLKFIKENVWDNGAELKDNIFLLINSDLNKAKTIWSKHNMEKYL